VNLNLAQISSTATAYNQGRGDYSASEASFYANIALVQVATAIQMQPLESLAISSTTSGENRMSLPPDFDYVISLSYLTGASSGFPALTMRDAFLLDSGTTFAGPPREFAVYSTWMELAPIPDSAYSLQLRYGAKIPALLASTDTPSLSDRYHYAVALKTAELLAAARNDSEQEALNHQRYMDYMGSIPSDQAFRQRDKLSMGVSVPRGPFGFWPPRAF